MFGFHFYHITIVSPFFFQMSGTILTSSVCIPTLPALYALVQFLVTIGVMGVGRITGLKKILQFWNFTILPKFCNFAYCFKSQSLGKPVM